MTDITRKLELVANIKPGSMWPAELGEAMNWGTALSAICAEALAEINRLRAGEQREISELVPVKLGKWPEPVDWERVFYGNGKSEMMEPPLRSVHPQLEKDIPRVLAGQGLRIMSRPNGSVVAHPSGDGVALTSMAHPEPAPEPWGSPFAMNTENWT